MIVKIKRENTEVDIPNYESQGASGFDFHAYLDKSVWLEPRDLRVIPTGLSFEIPSGFEMQVRTRSGLAANDGIVVLNSPGTVDSDYRGEVKIILMNLGSHRFKVSPGDRIAQGVICVVQQVRFEEEELSITSRGSSGFGSTGTNNNI